jgi:two-component system OmpR family sensor kinase
VPALGLATEFSIEHAIAPLTGIATRISSRDAGNLTPIELGPEQTPPEIQPLLSALNRLMERLDESLKKQRQFVSDAAHELRTPLTAISFQLQSIQSAATMEDRAERLGLLRGGIDRASHLVAQLLCLARAENGLTVNAGSTTAELIRLDRLVTETLSDFLPLAERKQIDLGILSITPLQLMGDSDSLRAMIGNLIDNAIRYAPVGTSIDISLTRDGGVARLMIQDQGPGLCEAVQQRIFDRFYRGPADDRGSKAAGTGIGLAIVKAAVERHCGQINLRNRSDGPGLIVTIAFDMPAVHAA